MRLRGQQGAEADLGCPIDWAYDAEQPEARGNGWLLDDQRPTLTLTYPQPGENERPLSRILIGAYDYDSGLDVESLSVIADFEVNGVPSDQNLADRFERKTDWTWELVLDKPLLDFPSGRLTVSIKDRQGNINQINRTFHIRP